MALFWIPFRCNRTIQILLCSLVVSCAPNNKNNDRAVRDSVLSAITNGSDLVRHIEQANPGQVIQLEPKAYEITQPIVIRKPITLLGAGMFETTIRGTNDVIIDIPKEGSGTTIQGIGFLGNGSARGVRVEDAQGVEISDCRFIHLTVGIGLIRSDTKVHHNLIIEASVRGISLTGFSGPLANNTVVNTGRDQEGLHFPDWGIQGTVTSQARVSNNLVYNNNGRQLHNAIYLSGPMSPTAFVGNRKQQGRCSGFSGLDRAGTTTTGYYKNSRDGARVSRVCTQTRETRAPSLGTR